MLINNVDNKGAMTMGRPRKIAATMEKVFGTTATMERPKVVTVEAVKCPHCEQHNTSRIRSHDDRFVVEQGIKIKYMVCRSQSCMSTTNGEGRPWIMRVRV